MKPEDIQRENEAAALSARWVIVWIFLSFLFVVAAASAVAAVLH
jgi:hypothetical protein